MIKNNELPTWSKGVIALIITGGGAFALYKLYSYLKARSEQTEQRGEITATQKKLDDEKKAGRGGGITDLEAEQIANKLQTAFNGYGTDNKAIYNLFAQIKNDYDLTNVRKFYGIRKVSSGRFNLAKDFEGTLDQTIIEEMSSKEIQNINLMLAKKGIRNRF